MRVLLIGLLLVGIALAGCSSKGSNDDGEEIAASTSTSATSSSGSRSSSSASSSASSSTTTTSSSTSTSAAPAPAENGAPAGVIAATVNGTRVAFSLDGSDPDGDKLTWTLDFGDGSAKTNGTTLPAAVDHTYATAGNFTAVFGLSDGNITKSYNATVTTLVAAAPGLNAVAEVLTYCATCSDSMSFRDFPVPVPVLAIPSMSWTAGEAGFDATFLELSANLVGLTYSATSTQGDPDGVFWSECSPMGTYVGPILSVGPESGTVPAGAGCMVLWEYPPVLVEPTVPPIVITIAIA